MSDPISNMPLADIVPVLTLILIGMVLWLAGRRVLRIALAAMGLLAGIGLGWALGNALTLPFSALIPAAIFGLTLACLTALAYRVAIAAALALVCGVAGPVAVVTIGEVQGMGGGIGGDESVTAGESPGTPAPFGSEPETPPEPDEASDWLDRGADTATREAVGHLTDQAVSQFGLDEEDSVRLAEGLEEVRHWTVELIDDGVEAWGATPAQLRPAIVGAGITGALAGLLLGTLAPGVTASIVSAFGGSLIWLGGVRVLLARLGEAVDSIMPTQATWMLVTWLIISLAGVAIQWTFRPKPADTAG